MTYLRTIVAAFASVVSLGANVQAADAPNPANITERGRYLVGVGACNDCHTEGFNEAAGRIEPKLWLMGSTVGFQGPWGTSYPVNLRLYAQNMTEAQWLARVRQPMRPPMPWFNLREMTDDDLIAIYRFIRALGPAGASSAITSPSGSATVSPAAAPVRDACHASTTPTSSSAVSTTPAAKGMVVR